MTKRKTLADTIRDGLAAKGVSVYRLAKESGVGERTLGRFMNRENTINLEHADKLLIYLEATIELPKPKRGGR